MAKKKKNKKKTETMMLPKRIAGVKIPKPLRRQGHHLAELARHPLVADVVAAGIVALAASMRDKQERRENRATPSQGPDAPAEPPAPVSSDAAAPAANAMTSRPGAASGAPADGEAPAAARTARRKPAPRASATTKTTH